MFSFPTQSSRPTSAQQQQQKDPLAACVDQLASLSLSIRLAAQFADSPTQEPARQQELRLRLAVLRRQYTAKLDEIFLILKIQKIKAWKEEIESQVTAPAPFTLPMAATIDSIDPCI